MNQFGRTALITATFSNKIEVVKYLIANGACIDMQHNLGFTAFAVAFRDGHLEIIKLLFDSGANANIRDREGKKILDINSKNGKSEAIRLLKRLLLYKYIKEGNLSVVKYYVKNKLPLDIIDENGNNPLHIASYNNHADIFIFILSENPALISKFNNDNQNPLMLNGQIVGDVFMPYLDQLKEFGNKLILATNSKEYYKILALSLEIKNKNLNQNNLLDGVLI